MKILMINSVCGVGSTGRICTDIAQSLEQNGHIVKIAYGRTDAPEKYERFAVRICNSVGVKFHVLFSRITDKTGFYSKRATRKFIKWVKEFDPDVIHLHNLHGYYVNLRILFDYLKNCGKKIVWTLHDCWAFTGHCSHFDFVGCDKWKTLCEKCSQKKRYPKSLFLDDSKKNYLNKKELFCGIPNLTIITPSKWLANLVGESFLQEYPIKVINNGIDLSVFKPTESDFREKYHLQDKKLILGVASAWDDRKGLNDFIELSKILDENYKVVLVGVTEKQKKNLPQNILAISRTNSTKELAEIYTASDVFVNLTYEDSFPTVNLEAQACGTPVITYMTGGSVESAQSENVVKKGDLKALCQLLKYKLSNNTEKNKNSLNVETSSKLHMIDSYLKIY